MKSLSLSGKKRYLLLFILGMIIFLYPAFSNIYYSYIIMGSIVEEVPKSPKTHGDGEKGAAVSENELKQIELDPEMKPLLGKDSGYIKEYNKRLWEGNEDRKDPFGDGAQVSLPIDGKGEGDGVSVFAYIKIPKINQTLPLYLGATEEHLKKGVAVIKGTSIPIGGENTNSVIAGHTGYVKRLFTDLPQLKPGDEILIRNSWETLYYRVTGNKLIMPDEEEYLSVVPGKDMITLLTCYHGTSKNDRLLVFAERYYPEKKVEWKKEEKVSSYVSEVEIKAKGWYEKIETFVAAAGVILVFLFLYSFLKRR